MEEMLLSQETEHFTLRSSDRAHRRRSQFVAAKQVFLMLFFLTLPFTGFSHAPVLISSIANEQHSLYNREQ
jgi:hypothetical protein